MYIVSPLFFDVSTRSDFLFILLSPHRHLGNFLVSPEYHVLSIGTCSRKFTQYDFTHSRRPMIMDVMDIIIRRVLQGFSKTRFCGPHPASV